MNAGTDSEYGLVFNLEGRGVPVSPQTTTCVTQPAQQDPGRGGGGQDEWRAPASRSPAAATASSAQDNGFGRLNAAPPPTPGLVIASDDAGNLQQVGLYDPQLESVLQETSKHLRSIGLVNIVVAGQTGVGKSSLINAVFGEEFARTAAGRPVTQQAEWFTSDKIPLRVLDTKGLEAKDYTATVEDLRAEIELARSAADPRDQLHIAWVCISAPSSRIQDCEIDIIRVLNRYNIPVIVVLTRYDDDDEFLEIVDEVLAQRRVAREAIIGVRAVAKKNRPTVGLTEVVTATFRALPNAHRAAFAASQKVNLDLNREAANEYVTAAAAAAAAAAIIPIPFADALALAPIQTGMLVAVSATFGLQLDRAQMMQLLTTVMGCLALSVAGRWAVGSVMKLLPGPGSIIGAGVNAGLAGSLTMTLGRVYINFLHDFILSNRRVPSADEIITAFPEYYRGRSKAVPTS